MARRDSTENRLFCTNCNRDTFAIRREDGLEVKYRDRWILVLNDTVGTILFRCRVCKSITALRLGNGEASVMHHLEPGNSADRKS